MTLVPPAGLLDVENFNYRHIFQVANGRFLKGLAVVGDLAYFGASDAAADLNSRLNVKVTLVAVNLNDALADAMAKTQREPHFATVLPGVGLLNQVVAPSYICSALDKSLQASLQAPPTHGHAG